MTRPIRVLGVDPGLTGALAYVDIDPVSGQVQSAGTIDMPTVSVKVGGKTRNDILEGALVETLAGLAPAHAYVERVGPAPGEGAVGAFKFGAGWGLVRGVLAGLRVPTSLVTPQSWKKAAGIPAGATKDQSRQLASRLYPNIATLFARKKDDGRAEALLLAHVMARVHLAPAVAQPKPPQRRVQ